jgi:hypothetical protein
MSNVGARVYVVIDESVVEMKTGKKRLMIVSTIDLEYLWVPRRRDRSEQACRPSHHSLRSQIPALLSSRHRCFPFLCVIERIEDGLDDMIEG